jgi:hypothetical protein
METARVLERSLLQNKSPNKGDGQYWSVLPLAQKMLYITNISCRFFVWQPSYPRLQKEASGKQKAWRKKWKYASFLWLCVFPLQLFPLQLFQDHRDSNVEASGIAMTCSFHQAVPGSLQVVIPVRNIWRKRKDSCWKWDLKLKHENQIRMKILPPTNSSKLMRRSRSALQ